MVQECGSIPTTGQLHYGRDIGSTTNKWCEKYDFSVTTVYSCDFGSCLYRDTLDSYTRRVTSGTVIFGEHWFRFRYRRHPETAGTLRSRLVRAEGGSHIFDTFVCSPVQERDCTDVCSLTRLLPITNSNVEQLPFPVIALSTRSAVTHHHRCPYGVGQPLPTIYLSCSQTMSFCLVAVLPDSHVTYVIKSYAV